MLSWLKDILTKLQKGEINLDEALQLLQDFPYQDLHFAKIDHHRELRKGMPEVIFGLGKSTAQIKKIAEEIKAKKTNLLITRIDHSTYDELKKEIPELKYHSLAKVAYLKVTDPVPGKGIVAVVTAGTSDIPVAEEAAITCEILGNQIIRIYDVGVAGLHRLLGEYTRLRSARVVITVAGMEGALPSVIAGLTKAPVIACPTSIGYGASFNGLAALLTMLNSCPGGVGVVNIDNGFGAGYLASLINHLD